MNTLSYFPRNTIMHKVDPRVKILMYISMSIFIFLVSSITSMLFILLTTFILSRIAKLPKRIYVTATIPILFVALLTTLVNVIAISPRDGWLVWEIWPGFEITAYALFLSLRIMIRVYGLVLFSGVLLNTTEQREMASAITWLIYPLKYIKVPINEIGLIITLGLRFIPTLLFETKIVLRAQASRGLSWYSGGIRTRIKAFSNIFLPLFVNNFNRADDIANAMAARGYKIGEDRTSYYQPKVTWRDFIYIGIMGVLLTMILLSEFGIIPHVADPEFWWGSNPWW